MSDIGINWDDWFENGGYIPGGADFPKKWERSARAYRSQSKGQLDLAYGTGPREVLDLFLPEGAPKGLLVFVHGGYWIKFDKTYWSHFAAGPVAEGWVVAIPSYPLAPKAQIPEITECVARAIDFAADHAAGPIRLAGHSAGGHLITRMVCQDSPLGPKAAARIDRVMSISGVHDLRQLQLTQMNSALRLDSRSAIENSPALMAPRRDVDVVVWVGAQERPEFLRQSRMLEEAWSMEGAQIQAIYEADKHHFDVVEGLALPGSAMNSALLD